MKRSTVWLLTVASGVAVANLYYNQPLLAEIARSLNASVQQVGYIPTLTQIGYAVGLILIVPLGDAIERRRLLVILFTIVAGALVAAAVSPNIIWLAIASLAIGITTIVPQLIIPFVAQLAEPQERGKAVGTVVSGLLLGILLARTVSGFVGSIFNWRVMYWLASALMIIFAVAISRLLPKSQPSVAMSYRNLMHSLLVLIREQPVLREAALIQAMEFGAFSVFWSTLVFLLENPPYHYGSQVAGLFGLVGAVGATAAPLIGRLADRKSPRRVVGIAIAITTSAFLLFWLFGYHLWGLIVGVILLDLGLQSAQVPNQTRITSLVPEAASRANAVFVACFFCGGASGSFLGTYAWSKWQWHGVCLVGLCMLTIAWMIYFKARKTPPSVLQHSVSDSTETQLDERF
ncbi:MAG TPA: MFS transporter [Chroococcales cyanobacterium]